MPIIDYEPLNRAIMAVENAVAEFNVEERLLILNHCRDRVIKELQRTKEKDTMQRAIDNLPLGIGKMMKRAGKAEEGEG